MRTVLCAWRGSLHSSGRNSFLLNVVWDVIARISIAILVLPEYKASPERRAEIEKLQGNRVGVAALG